MIIQRIMIIKTIKIIMMITDKMIILIFFRQ